MKYNDISWVSAKITGTKLVVQIKEADLKADEEKSAAPGDIVADSDGMIESIVVRRGTAAVAPGDWVRAGDVLIYGKVIFLMMTGVWVPPIRCGLTEM